MRVIESFIFHYDAHLIRSSLFDEVQANSLQVWKWEQYRLLEEFDRRPTLPAPFVLVEDAYRAAKRAWKTCCRKSREDCD